MTQELEQLKQMYALIYEFLVNYSFQLVGALLIFVIGLLFARKTATWVFSFCSRHKLDITLSRFISNGVKILVLVMVTVISLGKIGISVTPFVAAIGAASLGAGLALQGMLSNYGAGFSIILTRPFVVGNTIEVQGVTGVVKEVTLGMTYLTNEEGETISIPNKHIVGEILHNSLALKLAVSSVGVAYDSDMDRVIALIQQSLNEVSSVSEDKPALIGIDEFGDSAVVITARYWVPTEQFFDTRFRVNRAIFKALRDAGVVIPFPQRDVRLLK